MHTLRLGCMHAASLRLVRRSRLAVGRASSGCRSSYALYSSSSLHGSHYLVEKRSTTDSTQTSFNFASDLQSLLIQLNQATDSFQISTHVDQLLELVDEVRTKSGDHADDVLLYEVIFRALSRADLWEKAVHVFETHVRAPDLTCYRAILRVLAGGYLDQDEDTNVLKRGQEALRIFNQMLYIKLQPESECAAYAMTAQRKCGNVDEVERIFLLLQETKQPISQQCYNTVILSCGSRLMRAQQLFSACESQGKANADTYYGLILSSTSNWKTAIATLQRLLDSPHLFTSVLTKCFEATLKACAQARQVEATQAAFTLLSHWKQRTELDPLSSIGIDFLLSMCSDSPQFVLEGMSNPHMARYWLEEAKHLKPLPSWYSSAVKACAKGLNVDPVDEMALEFFQRSIDHGFRPSLVTYGTLINLLHDWNKIGDLLRQVFQAEAQVTPDVNFIGGVLEKMMGGNQLRKAQRLYDLSVKRMFVPSHWLSYNPPVLDLHNGNFALSICALKAGLQEMHELYQVIQSSGKKQSQKPRRVKHPLLLVCSLDDVAQIQKKLAEDMSITAVMLTKSPRELVLQLPKSCAFLQVDVRELTFWHFRGALGI